MSRRISVIGGDMRQQALSEYLIKDGFDVSVYGFDECGCAESLSDALSGSKVVVLGINPCREDMNISTPERR